MLQPAGGEDVSGTLKRVCKFLFGRRERAAPNDRRETLATLANLLTIVRATVAGGIFVLAIVQRSHTLILIGLAVSMVLDFFDGIAARTGEDETIIGAQLDGAADRIAAAFVAGGMVALDGDGVTVAAAVAVWLQFGVVDGIFAGQFLRFGLWSPDHFYAIDPRTWRLHWSAGAKLASNLPIALLAVGGDARWAALGLAAALIVLRLPSYARVREKARALEEKNHARRTSAALTETEAAVEAVDERLEDFPARDVPEEPAVPPLSHDDAAPRWGAATSSFAKPPLRRRRRRIA